MQEERNERIIDRLDRYARERNLNDNRITKDAGLSVGLLGKYRKPGKDMTRKAAQKILDTYPDISPNWLLFGSGPRQREAAASELPTYPFIDNSKAECGRAAGLAEAARIETLPRLALPGIPRETEFFIMASGHSMINRENPELSIPPSALVGLARVNSGIIRWGEVYALVTADGVMIKRVLPDPDNSDTIRCLSYNSEEFPPFDVRKEEIREVARITCVVPIMLR